MSKQTSAALARARADEEVARKNLSRAQRQCLSDIAEGLMARVDDVARKLAYAQAEVTKGLGKTGVQELKHDLAGACAALAESVKGAVGQVDWPTGGGFDVSGYEVRSAVTKFFSGARVNEIAAVFEKHGYNVHRSSSTYQTAVPPDSMYGSDAWFQGVADAINGLRKAEQKSVKAKTADDEDIIDDLWG